MTSSGHGKILGAVVTTPDVDAALQDYRDRLGLTVVADGLLGASAMAWGAPALTQSRCVWLAIADGFDCHLCLVEQPIPQGFVPTTTFGWAACEFTVQDVHGWSSRLVGSGFDIVGPPRSIAGMPSFTAMQMLGRGGEMVYLNEVHADLPKLDLPRARTPIDRIFMAILATDDLPGALAWYARHLRLEPGETHAINYTMINRAFSSPDGTLTTLAVMKNGRAPILEIDAYPDGAQPRTVASGHLPSGNAIVTLAVDRLPALPWIGPPTRHDGPLHTGRVSATTLGPAGELIELVEM